MRRVAWPDDDALVIEVEHAARQLGFTFQDTLSFLAGLGLGRAQELGMITERALGEPDPKELFRQMAAYYLGVDPEAFKPRANEET